MVSPLLFALFPRREERGGDLKDEGAHVVVEVEQSRPVDVQD